MTRIIAPLLALSIFFIACNNEKSEDNTAANKEVREQGITDTTKIKKGEGEIQQLKEELSNLAPLSSDELKVKIPEQLTGVTATDAEVSGAMGALIAKASYKINDSSKVKLEIIDCAGPGGSGLFAIQYMDLLDDKESSDNETTFNIIDFSGRKAFESCSKSRPGDCSFTFLSGNRFLVLLQGEKTGINMLKELAKELKIK